MAKTGEMVVLFEGSVKTDEIRAESNIRKVFEKKAMSELADNVRRVGVLQPVLLRKNGSGYILIAGERRYRAAKEAGLNEIPARVLDVTEDVALEIQAFENLHRKDLGPIEEARAFKLLLDKGNYTVETLANRVDKSRVYVYRSIRILELSESAQALIEKESLTVAHGYQLLRAPEKERDRFAQWAVKNGESAKELREAIDEKLGKDLSKAPFPKDRSFGGKPACIGCPFNSESQQDLLGETIKGRCTGPDCFKVKSDAFITTFIQEQKQRLDGVKYVGTFNHEYDVEARQGMMKLPPSAPILAQVKKDPGNFHFAVIREREWNNPTPAIVIIGKNTNAVRRILGLSSGGSSGGGSNPDAERPSRIEAISRLGQAAQRKAIWERLPDLPTAEAIRELLKNDYAHDELCQILQITEAQLKTFDQEQMLKALWFVQGSFGDDLTKGIKIDSAAISKSVVAAASLVWPKNQSPACKVCGCTPNRGCRMEKGNFRSCWWVVPGLCSACQAQGKMLPEIIAPAKKKAGKK